MLQEQLLAVHLLLKKKTLFAARRMLHYLIICLHDWWPHYPFTLHSWFGYHHCTKCVTVHRREQFLFLIVSRSFSKHLVLKLTASELFHKQYQYNILVLIVTTTNIVCYPTIAFSCRLWVSIPELYSNKKHPSMFLNMNWFSKVFYNFWQNIGQTINEKTLSLFFDWEQRSTMTQSTAYYDNNSRTAGNNATTHNTVQYSTTQHSKKKFDHF